MKNLGGLTGFFPLPVVQEVCRSGKMGRRQFKDFYQAAFTGMRPEAFAFYDHLFRAYDEDSSGTLDFKEFIQVSGDMIMYQ